MQVTYRLEDSDYWALARFLIHDTPKGRKAMRRQKQGAVILSVVAALIVFALKPDAVLAVLFGAFCYGWTFLLRQRSAKIQVRMIYRVIRPDETHVMREPGTLMIDANGLEAKYGKETSKISWRGVSRIAPDASHLFILMGQMNALVIPRREFESPEAYDNFFRQASEYHAQAWGRTVPAAPHKQ